MTGNIYNRINLYYTYVFSKPGIYFLLKLWKIEKQVKGLGKNTGAVTIETM